MSVIAQGLSLRVDMETGPCCYGSFFYFFPKAASHSLKLYSESLTMTGSLLQRERGLQERAALSNEGNDEEPCILRAGSVCRLTGNIQ